MEFDGIGMGAWISFGGPKKEAAQLPNFKPLDPAKDHAPNCPCRIWYGDFYDRSADSSPSTTPPKQTFMPPLEQHVLVTPKQK